MDIELLDGKLIGDQPEIVEELSDLFKSARSYLEKFHTDDQLTTYDEDTSINSISESAKANGARTSTYDKFLAAIHFYFVKNDEGKVVGAIRAVEYDEATEGATWRNMIIGYIAVNSDHRREGIGRRLVEHVESDAFGRLDRQTIFASVNNDNDSSNALFRQLGYERLPHNLPHLSKNFFIYKKGD